MAFRPLNDQISYSSCVTLFENADLGINYECIVNLLNLCLEHKLNSVVEMRMNCLQIVKKDLDGSQIHGIHMHIHKARRTGKKTNDEHLEKQAHITEGKVE